MSAEKPNTTSRLSRRDALAGLSVAAAAGVAALPAGGAEVDPIFAMIELHRKAWLDRDRTQVRFKQHKDDPSPEPIGVVVGEKPKQRLEIFGNGVDEQGWRRVATGETEPIIAYCEKQIAEHAPKDLTDADRAAWIKTKTTEMCRRKGAESAHYKNTPRSLAYDAWNNACNVVESVTNQLVNTRPTTIGGVAAVLAYWSEIASEVDGDEEPYFETDLNSTVQFLEKMAVAAKAVGGRS
jgi:hypothetical protein